MGISPDGSTYNEKGVGTPLVNGPVETKWRSSALGGLGLRSTPPARQVRARIITLGILSTQKRVQRRKFRTDGTQLGKPKIAKRNGTQKGRDGRRTGGHKTNGRGVGVCSGPDFHCSWGSMTPL